MGLAETLRELRPELIAVLRAARTLEIRAPQMSVEEITEIAEDIGRRAEFGRIRIDEALEFTAREQQMATEPGRVDAAVHQALSDLELVRSERSIDVETSLDSALVAMIPTEALTDVLRTLLAEIFKYVRPDSSLRLTSRALSGMALIQVHHTGATEQFIRQGRQLTSAAVPTRQGSETRESGLVGQVLRAMVRMLNGLLATDVEGDAVTVSLAFHRHPGGSARVIHLDDERARHNQH